MAGIERLHPHVQHAIVHNLGWRSLRPVQELTIDAILDGCNSVVLAPTAGGKTEAAIFPLLSRVLTESLKPAAVLYICPIRALLNNQEDLLQSYARMVGLEVFKWHGDVSDSRKQRFREASADIFFRLQTTCNGQPDLRHDAQQFLEGPRQVIDPFVVDPRAHEENLRGHPRGEGSHVKELRSNAVGHEPYSVRRQIVT
jgi:superfamily II DNA helicase RecQ